MNRLRPQATWIDPMVEELAALLQRSRLTDEAIAQRVGEARGHRMSARTVRRVRELETGRCTPYTAEWLGWAIGFRRTWEPCA